MTGRTLALVTDNRDLAYRLAGALGELMEPAPTAVSIFEDGADWRVAAYFDGAPEAGEAYVAALRDMVGQPRDDAIRMAWEDIPDLNWVALSQEALPPVETRRFTVHGSHDRHRVPAGPWSIEIEAGEAFGTAHHATTYGCLNALARLPARITPETVLDLGTGTGVLAIAAARLWPRAGVVASDIDTDAVRVARQNAVSNGAAGRIEIRRADGIVRARTRGAAGASYDLIVANILAGPLIAMSGRIARAVRPRGVLVLSGILTPQARAVQAAYRRHGLVMVEHAREAGWSVLVMRKRPMR